MNETSTKWLQIVDVVDKNGKQNYVTTEYRMPRLYANNILMKQLPKKSSLKRQCPFVRNVRTKPKKCRYYDYSEWLGCAEMSGKNSYYCDAHAKSISILKPAFDLYTKIVRKTSLIRSRAKTKWTGMAFEVNNVKHTGYDAVRYHNEKEGIESYYNINDRKDARQNERLKFEKEYPEAYDPFTKTQEYKKGAFQMRTLFTKRIFNVTFEEALRGRYAFGLLDQPCLFKTPKYSDFYVDNFVNNNIQVSIQRFTQLMFKARCANDYSLFRRYELYLKEILKKKLATKALTYGQCNFLTDNKRKVTCQMKGKTFFDFLTIL